MNVKIKKGDFVARKSYKQDVLFVVDKIINLKDGSAYVILKGVTIRIEADAPIEDIVRVDESKVTIAEKRIEKLLLERIKNNKIEHRNNIIKNKNR
jgi:spore coat assembly protein